VSTLVVSDLHLGSRARVDLLRGSMLREPLTAALRDGIERLVLLGDALELRQGPLREALGLEPVDETDGVRTVRPAVRLSRTPADVRRRPPRLGEHDADIRAWLSS